MKRAIVLVSLLFVAFLIIINPKVAIDHSHPSYIGFCGTEWTFHWWGAFNKRGLLGFYSLDNAANSLVKINFD